MSEVKTRKQLRADKIMKELGVDNIIKQIGPLDDTINSILKNINEGGDYDVGIDIIQRSRALAALYFKIGEDYKAVEILRVLIDYRYGYTPLNTPCEVAEDVEKMLKVYKDHKDKKSRIELLKTVIERYPDFSCINVWIKQLNNFKNVDK